MPWFCLAHLLSTFLCCLGELLSFFPDFFCIHIFLLSILSISPFLASPPFQVWSPGSPFDPGNSYAEEADLDQAEPLAIQVGNRTTDNLYGEDGGEGEEESKVAVSLLLTGIISFRCARQIKSSGQCLPT